MAEAVSRKLGLKNINLGNCTPGDLDQWEYMEMLGILARELGIAI